jgi:hypothetical protein
MKLPSSAEEGIAEAAKRKAEAGVVLVNKTIPRPAPPRRFAPPLLS